MSPYAPLPGCKQPLCPNRSLPGSSYCSVHKQQPISQQEKDRNKINSEFYASTAWRRLRRIKLNLNPLCEICLVRGIVSIATDVDHCKPIKEYPELRLVLDNLQSACKGCHSKKTREENQRENKKVFNL